MHEPPARTRSQIAALVLCVVVGLDATAAELPAMTVSQTWGIKGWWRIGSGQDWDKLQSTGASFVNRTGGPWYWDQVERSKGKYYFGEADSLLRHAEKKGLTVVACLFGGNKLYEDPRPGGIRTEAGRKGFAGFAAALAKRFKGRNVIFEIWNEPNIRGFWGNHGEPNSIEYADEYSALVKEVVPAMKEADPDCFIMAGSVSCLWSGSFRWMKRCFENGVLETGFDAWSTHPYSFRRPEDCIDKGYGRLRTLLTEYGMAPEFPILNSEVGYPLGEWLEGGGSPEDREIQLEHQAWMCARQYLVDQMCGVQLTIWYQWKTDEWGVVHDDTSPRPAYSAFRTLSTQLHGYDYKGRLPARSRQDYLVLFEDRRQRRKLVAWTEYPRGRAAKHDTGIRDVHVPVITTSPYLKACDIHGRPFKVPVMSNTIVLRLSGGPQYVDLSSTERPSEEAPVAPVVTVAGPEATEVGIELFDMLLKERVARELAAGRRPRYFSSYAGAKMTVLSMDDDFTLAARVDGSGTRFSVRWPRLSLAERSSLASAALREREGADHAVAAFYLMAIGELDRARDHLAAAGPLADEVLGAFE